eukprot:TRINITY_DN43592_c0_g1_i1.p1 TRINITY_DN43592_c0_g1~~TRINITY_DN43592_c0_g1_i1.p1  ORF type:complete len:853 (+),score=299.24 TRINITY_DN43592_c0_g1_i1:76-2634(+)
MRRCIAALVAGIATTAAYPAQLECGDDSSTRLKVNATVMSAPVQMDTTSNATIAVVDSQGAVVTSFTPGESLRVQVRGLPGASMVTVRASDHSGTLAGSVSTQPGNQWLRRKCAGQLFSTYKPGMAADFDFGWDMDCDGAASTATITVAHSGGMGRSLQLIQKSLSNGGGKAARCQPKPTPQPPATPAPAPTPPTPPPLFKCGAEPVTRKLTLVVEDWVVDFLRPTAGARQQPWQLNELVRKAAILVNGSYPAPTLEACVNDTFEITVINDMKSHDAIVHWHGIHSRKYPWADGAKGVTQAPIRAGNSMLYKFEAWPPGTHYYHSHMDGVQQAKGLRGPIVVHKRDDPHAKLYSTEQTIMVSDEWRNPEVCLQLEGHSNNEGNPVCAEIEHLSYNGQWGNGTSAYPFPVIDLFPGVCTRLRWINAGSNAQDFVIDMAGHNVTLLAVDSYDVHPVQVKSFKVAVGERVDVVVCGDQEPGYYRVNATYDLACSLTPGSFQPYGFGVVDSCQFYAFLRYVNTGAAPPVAPEETTCTRPYGGYCMPDGTGGGADPKPVTGKVFDLTTQDSLFHTTTPLPDTDFAEDEPEEPDARFVVNLGDLAPEYDTGMRPLFGNRWYVDLPDRRWTWEKPLSPLLHTKGKCGADKVPVINVPEKTADGKPVRTVELVMNDVSPSAHVMHIHGMPWKVINYADFKWCDADATQCFFTAFGTTYANQNCPYDQVKGDPKAPNGLMGFYWGCQYNATTDKKTQHLKGALVKDTFQIWRRSWAVLRVKTTNPGFWLVHCHMEQHIPLGMSFALNVLESQQPPIPAHVPREGPCPVWSDQTDEERLERRLAADEREIARLRGQLRESGR